MLKLLLKKQLLEIFRSYYYDAKKNKARSKAATIAYIAMFAVLMVVVLGGLFTCEWCGTTGKLGIYDGSGFDSSGDR